MIRALILAAALLSAPLLAQTARDFSIGGERFATSDLLDARAAPELDGSAGIMLTFTPAAAKRLQMVTGAHVGQALPIAMDGKTLAEPVVRETISEGVLTISGDYTLPQAEALAKTISGKDPVPEEFGE